MNKANGDMYKWIDYTWNPIAGQCPHNCKYCYVKNAPLIWSEKYKGKQRIHKKALNTNELKNITDSLVFVCSANDFGAANKSIKKEVLEKIKQTQQQKIDKEQRNSFLFQSKKPKELDIITNYLDQENIIIGTTIETNRQTYLNKIQDAPAIKQRIKGLNELDTKKTVTIEPILDFDLDILVKELETINNLEWITIGADSKNNDLKEPNKTKTHNLIEQLKKITNVKLKDNLKRLLQ